MIEKILRLRSIGQFADYAAAGPVHFDKLTLVYAENARGKTTLCAVLRSLASGAPEYIIERARFRATTAPLVEIRLAGANATFADGAWNRVFPGIAIFDDYFVYNNVHAGLHVTLNQRRNLHRIVIGQHGVELARRIEELDAESRDLAGRIRKSDAQIGPSIKGGLGVQQFCELEPRGDIDQAIADKQREVDAARNADAIRRLPLFSTIALPVIPVAEVRRLLSFSLPGLSAEVERQVETHFARIGPEGESWVSEGMPRVRNNLCPFCGQGLSGVALIQHFSAYFSQAYLGLKEDIQRTQATLRELLGGDALADMLQRIIDEENKRQFWAQYVAVPDVKFPVDRVRETWAALREGLGGLLVLKADCPLESLTVNEDIEAKINAYGQAVREVQIVSESLMVLNPAITAVKARSVAANLPVIVGELNRLMDTKARHMQPLADVCREYSDLCAVKRRVEADKEQARTDLNTHTSTVFPAYQDSINRYLGLFNADFQIADVAPEHSGGRPGSRYHIVVNNTSVLLGADDAPLGTPSFRNVLSAGDRNALALAFFLAQLDQDQNLGERVVVFDDPVSSFDEHRKTATQQTLCRLANRAAQVIVMSHSAFFLRSIWDQGGNPPVQSLKIGRKIGLAPQGSAIEAWDVEREVTTDHYKLYLLLREYKESNAGSVREVATAIRPFLEGYARVVYPESLRPGEWLGNFIEQARDAVTAGSPILSADELSVLEDIADYANKYHHNMNADCLSEPVNERELLGFVSEALDFVLRRPAT